MNIFKILIGDRKALIGDPMSLFLTFIPILIFLIIKLGLPVLDPILLKWVNIYDYYDFILFMVYLMSPLLLGMVLGLQLMDERDQDVLTYIAVTPFSLNGYLLLKCAISSLIAIIYNFILSFLLVDDFTIKNSLTFILAALMVPYFALAIYSLSKNKVEALTKGKLISFTIFGGVIPYFTSSNLVYLMAFLPTFWIQKVYFANNILESIISFLIGTLLTLFTIKIFKSRVVN